MENIDERGIYTDLVRELANNKLNVYVVFPKERRWKLKTEITKHKNITLLKVKTGNITKTNMFEKGLSTLLIEQQYINAIKKFYSNVKFDLVLYSTPPITFEKVVKYIKKRDNCKTYLILKDIFPQNAVDINILKKGSLIWKYFRSKEERLYKISEYIGCMSQGNIDYLVKHNPSVVDSCIEIFPNSIKPINRVKILKDRSVIYSKYGIPEDRTLFVYGGNLGKPQGIDFLLKVIQDFIKVKNAFLLIIGSGTEFLKLYSYIEKTKPINVRLYSKMPKDEYDRILEIADVGLIFLDRRFTIPNIPSRLTAYMDFSIPILAATDPNTDLRTILNESNSGLWVESGNINGFIDKANILSADKTLRVKMGMMGRQYLEKHFDISKIVSDFLKHLT